MVPGHRPHPYNHGENSDLFSPLAICFHHFLHFHEHFLAPTGRSPILSFPFLRAHRRTHRRTIVKSRKGVAGAGSSAAAGGKKGATTARITDGGWRRTEVRDGPCVMVTYASCARRG